VGPPSAVARHPAISSIHRHFYDMKKILFFTGFAGLFLLCGCNKQTKLNTQKIEVLTQRIEQLQQSQAKQLSLIQTQLTALAPMLDKMNDFYFEKSHDEAFFFHTNTLYLLLTVEKHIESQLQAAETERESAASLAYYYHTNQLDTMFFCVGQIQDALASQETRIENNVNLETRRSATNLGDGLSQQIKLAVPDDAEITRRKVLAAAVAQIQGDLDTIKVRLGITNTPAVAP